MPVAGCHHDRPRTLVRVIALVLTLGAFACRHERDPDRIVAAGHVEATDVRISTKHGGILAHFPLHEGDTVKEGQEVARLDVTDDALALRRAEAEAGQAQAALDLSLAGPRRQEVAAQEASVRSAEAELAGAEKDLERMQALLDRGSGTTQARDDARTRRDVARARVSAARQALSALREGSRREELAAARARVAAAEAAIAQVRQRIADATLASPVAGVVTAKLVEPGELLAPGTALAVVTDLASAWLTVFVAEPDVARLRLGQPAEVTSDAGDRRQGTVTFISSQAEFTPKNVQTRDERVKLVFKVKIGLDNRDGLFKPGMPGEARLAPAPASTPAPAETKRGG